MAFHGFGTATRMLSPTYWHVQTYFRPSTGGIQKHGALLSLAAGFRRPPLKDLEGGDFGIYIRKTLLRQMDAKRPRHGEGIPWGRGGWGPGSKNGCAPAAPPSPHGILLCTLILSISNGRHGVFSPPPLWNRISPCFCGIPFPPPPRFCALLPATSPPSCTPAVLWFSNCACGPERKENPPPFLWNRMVFPFAIHTHTHHVFVNVWPFYLPTPLLWDTMVFRFALRHIDTHTHHVSVYVWRSLSAHALLLGRRSILSPPLPPPLVSCHVLLYFNK